MVTQRSIEHANKHTKGIDSVPEDLRTQLVDSPQYPEFVSDCRQLVDDEVASKSGATGLTVKSAYKMVQKLKPNMIDEAVKDLLPELTSRLQPFYADYKSAGNGAGLSSYFESRQDEISEALLGLTDDRAERSNRGTIKKAYGMLRPQGKKHVTVAVPKLGELIAKHTGTN